jgi:hypothetical protein
VIVGKFVPGTALGALLTLSRPQITIAIAAYGFIASVLPVWMLLCPRDYLSSYMKLGTIAARHRNDRGRAKDSRGVVAIRRRWRGRSFPASLSVRLYQIKKCGAISDSTHWSDPHDAEDDRQKRTRA